MTDTSRCVVCGSEATTYFAGNPNIPLCSNPVCEQALIDEINGDLQIASDEMMEVEEK